MDRKPDQKHNSDTLNGSVLLNGQGVILQLLQMFSETTDIDIALQRACNIIPEMFDLPESVYVRITFDGNEYTSKNFRETRYQRITSFDIPNDKSGSVESYFQKQ